MCQKSCEDCDYAVFHGHDRTNVNGVIRIKPVANVKVFENGKPAKTIQVSLSVMRIIPVVEENLE
jgi:hypothetical protein